MTKQELKTQLKNSGFQLKPENEISKDGDYTLIDIPSKFIDGNVLIDKTVKIAVDTQNNAYFLDENPIFERDIKNFLDANFEGYFINTMNSSDETAEVTIYMKEENVIKKKRVFLNRDVAGNVQHNDI